jgi:hypothetical protein
MEFSSSLVITLRVWISVNLSMPLLLNAVRKVPLVRQTPPSQCPHTTPHHTTHEPGRIFNGKEQQGQSLIDDRDLDRFGCVTFVGVEVDQHRHLC